MKILMAGRSPNDRWPAIHWFDGYGFSFNPREAKRFGSLETAMEAAKTVEREGLKGRVAIVPGVKAHRRMMEWPHPKTVW